MQGGRYPSISTEPIPHSIGLAFSRIDDPLSNPLFSRVDNPLSNPLCSRVEDPLSKPIFSRIDDAMMPFDGVTALKFGIPLKGSMKQQTYTPPALDEERLLKTGRDENGVCQGSRKSIKWMDHHGKQLVDVKEFEMSDQEESDDEHEDLLGLCACVIQ